MSDTFRTYRRIGFAEMRPYKKGESLSGISVSEVDDPENDMGMVARNPDNHQDQWYVAREYFDNNFVEQSSEQCPVCGSNEIYEDRVDQSQDGRHCDACGSFLANLCGGA